MMPFYYYMKQFSIKVLKKKERKTLKVGALPGIDLGPLALKPDTLTTRLRGQVVRGFK